MLGNRLAGVIFPLYSAAELETLTRGKELLLETYNEECSERVPDEQNGSAEETCGGDQ